MSSCEQRKLVEYCRSGDIRGIVDMLKPHVHDATNDRCLQNALLEKRVHLDTLTEGETPLCAACKEGHKSVVGLLLDEGADSNVPNDWHNSAPFCG